MSLKERSKTYKTRQYFKYRRVDGTRGKLVLQPGEYQNIIRRIKFGYTNVDLVFRCYSSQEINQVTLVQEFRTKLRSFKSNEFGVFVS